MWEVMYFTLCIAKHGKISKITQGYYFADGSYRKESWSTCIWSIILF